MRRLASFLAVAVLASLLTACGLSTEVYFEIQGPDGTVVEITRTLNGNGSTREEVLQRDSARDENPRYGEKINVKHSWGKGASLYARVTLTSDGSSDLSKLKQVWLKCVTHDQNSNQINTVSSTYEVRCGVNFSNK